MSHLLFVPALSKKAEPVFDRAFLLIIVFLELELKILC